MRATSIVLLAGSVTAFALALRLMNRVPDFVDGLLFGAAIGCALVLYAWSIHRKLPKPNGPAPMPRQSRT